jgi:hypothetical protein
MIPAFTKVNRYVFDKDAYSWSLPSGSTCPGAEKCLAIADRYTGKVWNGPKQEFRCYSAVTERYPSVRQRLWTNFEAVKGKTPHQVASILTRAKPKRMKRCRIHTAGDFFSQTYFDGWLLFVMENPDIHFWAFTKSLTFWVNRLGQIPKNLVLQASCGGKHDHLIATHNLKYAKVVWSEDTADRLGLVIDTDDYLAAYGRSPFALLENFSNKKPKRESIRKHQQAEEGGDISLEIQVNSGSQDVQSNEEQNGEIL